VLGLNNNDIAGKIRAGVVISMTLL